MAANKKITLEKFYQEFVKSVRNNEKRWEDNEKRWVSNEKRWQQNTQTLKRLEKKIDKSTDFLDREVMANRRRIIRLETTVLD